MPEEINESSRAINRAGLILRNLDLSWSYLEDKKVLDIGSRESALANAATILKVPTTITSLDIEKQESWNFLSDRVRGNTVVADSQNLPFIKESFDIVLIHCSSDVLDTYDASRALKPGGELRIFPIGGQLLESWYIAYYLHEYINISPDTVNKIIAEFEKQIEDSDGGVPFEYRDLREMALNDMSQKEKIEVIDQLARRYSEKLALPFTYKVKDPKAHEPNAVLIYKKPK